MTLNEIKFIYFHKVLEAAHYIRPKQWYKDLWELDTENEENNGLQNEDLVTWTKLFSYSFLKLTFWNFLSTLGWFNFFLLKTYFFYIVDHCDIILVINPS